MPAEGTAVVDQTVAQATDVIAEVQVDVPAEVTAAVDQATTAINDAIASIPDAATTSVPLPNGAEAAAWFEIS